MGCSSSKRLSKTRSMQERLHQPLPRVSGLSVLEDLLLSSSYDQFVALVCKAKNLPAVTETDRIFRSNSKHRRFQIEDDGKFGLRNCCFAVPDAPPQNVFHGETLEQNLVSESEKINASAIEEQPYVINTWELMEGLDDGDESGPSIVATGSSTNSICPFSNEEEVSMLSLRYMEGSHSSEKWDYSQYINAQKKSSFWDRNSNQQVSCFGHSYEDAKQQSNKNSFMDECSLQLTQPSAQVSKNPVEQHVSLEPNAADKRRLIYGSELLDSEERRIFAMKSSAQTGRLESLAENTVTKTLAVEHRNIKIRNKLETGAVEYIIDEKKCMGNVFCPDNGAHEPDFSLSSSEWLYGGGSHLLADVHDLRQHDHFGHENQRVDIEDITWLTLKEPAQEKHRLQSSCDNAARKRRECSVLAVTVDANTGSDLIFDRDFLAKFEEAIQEMAEEERHLLKQIENESNSWK